MKHLSFFFLKNIMGTKMRRGFNNFCNNDSSTSTLNQHNASPQVASSSSHIENEHICHNVPPRKSVTLEEMILQLEIEEEKARREKMEANYKYKERAEFESSFDIPRRMSCVNNSDILRSARNALNQYPRFSLDGRDAMYRSSFRNNIVGGRSFDGLKLGRILHLPQSVGGESVVWCKPGLIAKLMGLEAMPVPISKLDNSCTVPNKNRHNNNKERMSSSAIRNHNLRRKVQRAEMERRERKYVMDPNFCCGHIRRSSRGNGGGANSCSSHGYCVMNPIAIESAFGLGGPISWPAPYN